MKNPTFFKGIIGALIVITVVVSVVLYYVNRHNTIHLTRRCARMNDFPLTAKDLDFDTVAGNTIQITLTFQADINEINRWIAESPGTSQIIPERQGTKRLYSITPADDAHLAELEIDDSDSSVKLFVEL